MNVEWIVKAFGRLTPDELYDVMQLRQAVFVVEQQCCYQDADGLDKRSLHVLGTLPSGQLACCLRIVPPRLTYPEPAIGRVVVDKTLRRRGVGTSLMRRGIEVTGHEYPALGIRLAAQKYLERFYSSFGFCSAGDDYLEDGIPHVPMYRASGQLQ
jgi:ElaA protein